MERVSPLKEKIFKTRRTISEGLHGIFSIYKIPGPEMWESMEELLISGDVGVETSIDVVSRLKEETSKKKLTEEGRIVESLKELLKEDLMQPDRLNLSGGEMGIVLVAGVNGTGKTTSIAKLANMLKKQGRGVLLVAADTYRAAAIEQLSEWGERIGVQVVKQQRGSDPAAVVFDAIGMAGSRGKELLIVDTAGRLHTQVNLMEELKKIKRVIARQVEGAPQEILMVIDATTGQNGISQARLFDEALGITGIFLAKLDGTAKGGIVIAIEKELGIPVKLIGTGEKIEDIDWFDPGEFIEALVGD